MNLLKGFWAQRLGPSSQLEMNLHDISWAEMPSFWSHTKVASEISLGGHVLYIYTQIFIQLDPASNCPSRWGVTLHYRIMVPWWLQNFCRDDAYLIHDDSYSITKYHPWWLFHPWWFLFHHKISTMMYHPWCKTITKISPMMIIPSMMILIWSQNITHDDYYIHNDS